PMEEYRMATRLDARCVQSDRAVDRALGDGVSSEHPVFGVSPRTLGAVDLLDAGRPRGDAGFDARTFADLSVHEEVAAALVCYDRANLGPVGEGIADAIAFYMKVVVEEETRFARTVGEIVHGDAADHEIAIAVDRVATFHAHLQTVMFQ